MPGSRAIALRAVLAGCLLLALGRSSQAAKFANQFTQFELPPQWQCTLEGTEWVCNSSVKTKEREALIVLAAKLRGDQDTVEKYLTIVMGPKTYESASGKTVTSVVNHAKKIDMDGIQWVDAEHMESEIPGYMTRYLATVKEDIAVLITYSIQKDKIALYQKTFDDMVKSLRVFRKKQLADNTAGAAKAAAINTAQIPTSVDGNTVFGTAPKPEAVKESRPDAPSGGGSGLLLPIVLLAGAAGGFILYKKKKAGG